MYNDHFGLARAPFKITPDTSQFFSGADRGSVLDAIVYAIDSGEGIVKVIGEVGTGKTMLCRMLQIRLPEHVELVYIANPNIGAENILNVIAMELKIISEPVSKLAAQNLLQDFLVKTHASGKRVVVFVEEAQGMPIETLEEIRMLTNLETDTDKLLQIVLFGQPELDKNLMQPSIRQLKERIAHNFYLKPLHIKDIKEYLNFRTRNTGYHGPDLFNEQASKAIGKYSKGLIRRVNIIADKAMLAAYADGTNSINTSHVKKAVSDSDFNANYYWQKSYLWPIVTLIALLALVMAAYVIYNNTRDAVEPVSEAKSIAEETLAVSTPVEKPAIATEQTALNVEESANNLKTEAPETSGSEADIVDAKIDAQYLDQSIEKEYSMIAELGYERLAARLQATHDWLKTAEDWQYTIQVILLRDRSVARLEQFLRKIENSIGIGNIYVYETTISGKLMYGVLYKQFWNKKNANQGIRDLPAVFDSSRPVILRTVKGIRKEIAASKI